MPISAPGSSSASRRVAPAGRRRDLRGLTLIELLIVIAIVAVSVGLMTLALRDSAQARLEEEGERLTALLEMARAEARVAGVTVVWVPRREDSAEVDPLVQFRFIGLSPLQALPTRWLDAETRAQVMGSNSVVLGPEAILPPQRIVLRLGDKRLELASDGLGPFALAPATTP